MFSFKDRPEAIKCIAEIIPPLRSGDRFVYLYRKKGGTELPNGFFKDLTLPKTHKFQYMPELRPQHTDRILTSASSGAGKTTKATELAIKICKVFGIDHSNIIIVIKSRAVDEAYLKLKNPTFIYVDDEFLESPPNLDDLTSDGNIKIVIIDDCDSITSDKLRKALMKFQTDCLECGRKKGIFTILCVHKLCDGKNTKSSLTESNYMLFFTDHITTDFKYCLTKYGDLSNSVIKDLKKINQNNLGQFEDWVLFHQHFPKFLLTLNYLKIFDVDEEEDRLQEIKRTTKRQPLVIERRYAYDIPRPRQQYDDDDTDSVYEGSVHH